jgi:uncharacterized phage-associated protein
MYKPLDITAYIIKLSNEIGEPLTNMKLQKLIYYVFAWYAVEKKEPLFKEAIMAWRYGPVVVSVYNAYQSFGANTIKEAVGGNPDALNNFTKSLIEDVFGVYGNKTAIELMNLTHSEAPWRDTYNPDNQNTPITFESMIHYYTAKKAAMVQ